MSLQDGEVAELHGVFSRNPLIGPEEPALSDRFK
jgi:hypothetical protein